MQILRRAEKRVHGALAVRRYEDVAARSRRTVGGRRRGEGNARGADIVGKSLAEAVVLDLADEGCARTETGNADNGIRRGTAGHFHRRTHRVIDCFGARRRRSAPSCLYSCPA